MTTTARTRLSPLTGLLLRLGALGSYAFLGGFIFVGLTGPTGFAAAASLSNQKPISALVTPQDVQDHLSKMPTCTEPADQAFWHKTHRDLLRKYHPDKVKHAIPPIHADPEAAEAIAEDAIRVLNNIDKTTLGTRPTPGGKLGTGSFFDGTGTFFGRQRNLPPVTIQAVLESANRAADMIQEVLRWDTAEQQGESENSNGEPLLAGWLDPAHQKLWRTNEEYVRNVTQVYF